MLAKGSALEYREFQIIYFSGFDQIPHYHSAAGIKELFYWSKKPANETTLLAIAYLAKKLKTSCVRSRSSACGTIQ